MIRIIAGIDDPGNAIATKPENFLPAKESPPGAAYAAIAPSVSA
jgi:hypothetical protein